MDCLKQCFPTWGVGNFQGAIRLFGGNGKKKDYIIYATYEKLIILKIIRM